MRKIYLAISGIPRGKKSVFMRDGKYHHRTDLLYKPKWGLERKISAEKTVERWGFDAPKAWPYTTGASTLDLYSLNETVYLAPAMKALDPTIKTYIMNQLDPGGRSGIGYSNVKWEESSDYEKLKDEDLPMHLLEGISSNQLSKLSRSIQRNPIKNILEIVESVHRGYKARSLYDAIVNPFPKIRNNSALMSELKPADFLTINRRYRPKDTKNPVWALRLKRANRSKRLVIFRKLAAKSEKLVDMSRAETALQIKQLDKI